MLVGALVAADAVLVIADALLQVLLGDLAPAVLMAAVAGVLLVILAGVAGGAFDVVVAVENEIAGMVEGGRLPPLLRVAGDAVILLELLMEGGLSTRCRP